MAKKRSDVLWNVLKIVVCIVILKVTWSIVVVYPGYFPANFSTDFLLGREPYFYGAYQFAFYPHILVGPLTLMLGLRLMSHRFRQRHPGWHRRLGKTQLVLIMCFLVPSGFWMAWYAPLNFSGKLGFALLAVLTGVTAWLGWRSAVKRKFTEHQLWMTRSFLLLCSAIVTRILGGLFTVLEVHADWTYYLAAWGSWLVPLLIFEATTWRTLNAD